MSQSPPKTFEDVRSAFETRRILQCSLRELEELLAALASETITDPATRARAREMGETIRQLHSAKIQRRPSKLAVAASVLALAALLLAGSQAYDRWTFSRGATGYGRSSMPVADALALSESETDLRTQTTIAELARRAPNLQTGTVQAWWAGEQARQVERLEAQAKRQLLAGDRDGASRSANRADAIRNRIDTLASFEKPPTR